MPLFKLQDYIFEVVDFLGDLLVVVVIGVFGDGRKQAVLNLYVLFAHLILAINK